MGDYVVRLRDLTSGDVARVGGKNASLGELIRALGPAGVDVPPGFATTAKAYWDLLAANRLREPIDATLTRYKAGKIPLARAGKTIRGLFERAAFPPALTTAITEAYRDLGVEVGREGVDVAVRSSATAEDLPEASFAGQQETFLNVVGEAALLDACRRCFASLFTDRAITYRDRHNIRGLAGTAVTVMAMFPSERSGILFTEDPNRPDEGRIIIESSIGKPYFTKSSSVMPTRTMRSSVEFGLERSRTRRS